MPQEERTPEQRLAGPAVAGRSAWVVSQWQEMRRLQERGEDVRTESFLANAPSDPTADDVVDLAYAEFVLRRERGETVPPQEFYDRFPDHRGLLERQFTLEEAVSGDGKLLSDTKLPVETITTVERSTPAIPQKIGKYVIVGQLSSGGQAVVYRAVHPELQHEVVLKFARESHASPQQDRLRTEGKLLAGLNHPRLGRVLDLDAWDDRTYLVSEYVRGRTVEQVRMERKFSAEAIAKLVADVADGVAAAHRVGICHLDIKPANVVCDGDGKPRLIDFGLAFVRDAFQSRPVEDEEGISGTLQYMAPEQASGDAAQTGVRTDVFGLGGLLFFLLTGQSLYGGFHVSETLQNAREGRWRKHLLKETDENLAAICEQALAKKPQQRYASAEQFANALRGTTQTERSNRWTWIAAAAVAIIICVGAFSGWFSGKSSENTPAPSATNPTAVVEPIQLKLQVDVWNAEQYRPLVNVAPPRNGDRVRVQSEVPAGVYATLFLLKANGAIERLASVEADAKSQVLRFPAETGTAAPLEGPPGTELLLICAQRETQVDDTLFDEWPYKGELWEPLPEMVVLRVNAEGVHHEQRSRDFGPPSDQPDPEELVIERLRDLSEYLSQRTGSFEAIAYYHARGRN